MSNYRSFKIICPKGPALIYPPNSSLRLSGVAWSLVLAKFLRLKDLTITGVGWVSGEGVKPPDVEKILKILLKTIEKSAATFDQFIFKM